MLSISGLFTQYLAHYPKESDGLSRLTQLVAQTVTPSALIARTNFVGHVTASGFVLNPDRSSVLLVYHKGLEMYLQPGGHLNAGDASPLEGARREVREETGLEGLHHLAMCPDPAVPFDIDSHYIPPNPKKGEPEHWHHDFRYLFVCPADTPLTIAEDEVGEARWVPLSRLGDYPTLGAVAAKLTEMTLEEGGERRIS